MLKGAGLHVGLPMREPDEGFHAVGVVRLVVCADRAGECVIFLVLEAPVRLTGLFGRLAQRIFGA
jgi:hypothetical protein